MEWNHRMAFTWRKSMRAIFLTSATTAVAFYANVFSQLMPVKSFGIYAGTIILINYFLVCMMLPSIIIAYEGTILPVMPEICGRKKSNRVDIINHSMGADISVAAADG